VPVNGRREHSPFKLFSFEAKVGVGRAEYARMGTERRDDRVANSDT
jgi:hypothetical protein